MEDPIVRPVTPPSDLDVHQKIGLLTRQLHDSLTELGYADQLRNTMGELPDAQSRLSYIARLTGEAAEKVLTRVIMNFLDDVSRVTQTADEHLTEIMMAQDFHDLTGQVIARVVALAATIEEQLVHLVIQTAPPNAVVALPEPASHHLSGPVVNPQASSDVVTDQSQVDDLLASLGF